MNKFPFRRSRHRLVRPVWLALVAACASAAIMAGESALAQDPSDPVAEECSGKWMRCVDECPSNDAVVAECEVHGGPDCKYDGGRFPCHNARFWACGWNFPFKGNNEIRCGYVPNEPQQN